MQKVNSSALTDKVWVYKATNSRDNAGNLIASEYTLRYPNRIYANVYQKDSKAVNSNNEIVHEITTTITVRYREDILESDILCYDQPTSAESVTNIRRFVQVGAPMHDRRVYTILTCKEIVPFGVVENG